MSPNTVEGVVVVLEGEVAPSLRQIAKRWSLTILDVESADQAFKHIRSARPRVIVVQIGEQGKEALKFIRLATAATRSVPLIAAATHHTCKMERSVLSAGATIYVPGTAPGFLKTPLEAVLTSGKRR